MATPCTPKRRTSTLETLQLKALQQSDFKKTGKNFRLIAEQLGVGGEQLIKRVLGHSDDSVTAIYNRYGYVKEVRAVLEKWASELTTDERRARQASPALHVAA